MPESPASATQAAIPMTEEQKYRFDLQGFLVMPGILDEAQTTACREQIEKIHREGDDLPPTHRSGFGGPLAELLDHPLVVGVLDAVLGSPQMSSDEAHGFRCESCFTTLRSKGHDNTGPHGGGGLFRFPGNSHMYHCHPGAMHTGLTRVVWEFNEIREGDGGTRFIPGSHKSAFPMPDAVKNDIHGQVWTTYTCPPGSVLFFTEAVTHTGAPWTAADRQRCAAFYAYNTVDAKFHHGGPTRQQLQEMPLKRRSLFRGVWWAFRKGEGPLHNVTVDDDNLAL